MRQAIRNLIEAYRKRLPPDAEEWERQSRNLMIDRAWDFLIERGWRDR